MKYKQMSPILTALITVLILTIGSALPSNAGLQPIAGASGVESAPQAEAPTTDPNCGGLRHEAEDGYWEDTGPSTTMFVRKDDSAASGGRYIENVHIISDGALMPVESATYCIEVQMPGQYTIRARSLATGPTLNSLRVYVDGEPAIGGHIWHLWATGDWVTTDMYTSMGNELSPTKLVLDLEAGQHQIAFAGREMSAKLDWFELVKVGDSGPPSTPSPTLEPTATLEVTPTPPLMATPTAGPEPTPTPFGLCGGLRQEAEDERQTRNMTPKVLFVEGADSTASGGRYISNVRILADGFGLPEVSDAATYCIDVPSDGYYGIRARARAADAAHNSLRVFMDYEPQTDGHIWHLWATGQWEITDLYTSVGNDPNTTRLILPLTAGQHILGFVGRELNADLDWFELVKVSDDPLPAPTPKPCGGLEQEAEDGTRSGGFTVMMDGRFSDYQYVFVPNGLGDRGVSIDEHERLSYCMTVKETGVYRILARTFSPDEMSNSFYVRVNGEPTEGSIWHTAVDSGFPFTTDYVTVYNPATGTSDPLEMMLMPGEHTIDFYLREDGTALDWIRLEKQSGDGAADDGAAGDGAAGAIRGNGVENVGKRLLSGTPTESDTLYLPVIE